MKIRIALIISLLAALAITGVYFRHQYRMGRRNIVTQLGEEKSMINILLAGSNEFNENRHRLFMVLSINPENNKIGFTFIPPDFSVDSDEDGIAEKISEIGSGKYEAVAEAVGSELDLKIPFYAVLYSPDLARICDLVYGINLFVYEKEKMGHGISFGINYLDGSHLVDYINLTENASIYSKYDRIMDVVFALNAEREQYRQFAVAPLVELALETVETNLNSREILSLSQYFFDNSKLVWTLLPGKLNSSGLYVMDEIARTVFRDSFLKKLVIEEEGELALKAKLLNATAIPGLARKYRAMLMREGVNVVEFGTYEDRQLAQTLIIDRKGNARATAYLSELIGTERAYQVIDTSQLHDIVIMLGDDAADIVSSEE